MDVDKFLKNFGRELAELQLLQILWDKLKRDWWLPFSKEQLYIDDKENVLALKIDDSIIMLGYLHFRSNFYQESNFRTNSLKYLAEFVEDLKKIGHQNSWNNLKIVMVTTYKLSAYERMNFNLLPDDANYFYMTESPEAENRQYEMTLDQGIVDFKSGDTFLDYIFNRANKQGSKPEFWGCEICGGNQDSGCLLFDPTECRRFRETQ